MTSGAKLPRQIDLLQPLPKGYHSVMVASTKNQLASDYPTRPDIEVLICTHNRVDLLEKTVASLNACDRPAQYGFGIFVVANACSDSTTTYLNDYIDSASGTELSMRWIEDPIPGKSHALNLALPQTTGKLIAFVDDDHRVDRNYLKSLCEGLSSYPEADLYCGRILPDWDGSEPSWVHESEPYRIYPLPVPRFELGPDPKPVPPGTATPGGGNLAIRQGLFSKVGAFRLELGPQGHNLGGAEDIEWVKRAITDGAQLYYLPDMLQYHYVDSRRLTLAYVMRKAYERSSSTVRLGDQHRGKIGIPPYMLRKSLTYFMKVLTSLTSRRRRFFLTRFAASLGEIKGARLQRIAHSLSDRSGEKS